MTVYVCIGRKCSAKEAMTIPDLLRKVDEAKEVEQVAAEWAEREPDKTSEQIFITRTETMPDGTEREKQISVSEARMEFYDLQRFLGECTSCPANVASDRFKGGVFSGFGCAVRLPEPVPSELEAALMAGAKRAVELSKIDPAIQFLDGIGKRKIVGTTVQKMRSDGKMEGAKPISMTYGGFLSKKTVTSDQMLEMFTIDGVNGDDAMLYHHFLEKTNEAIREMDSVSLGTRDLITSLSAIYGTASQTGASIDICTE